MFLNGGVIDFGDQGINYGEIELRKFVGEKAVQIYKEELTQGLKNCYSRKTQAFLKISQDYLQK